jgi:hypothetical protein
MAGCGGGRAAEASQNRDLSTPTVTQPVTAARSAEANAALTRVASSLAAQPTSIAVLPTTTPTPLAAATEVPLPTLTPTIVPSPVATRTIDFGGNATLRLQLNNDRFESQGEPVTIPIDARTYVLGGETMTQSEEWCTQVGPTGLVFDLTYTLQPTTETLHVAGQLRLYDGFCGQWGSLGNLLSTVPIEINVPVGTTALLQPALQVQGSFMGVPNLLDINTGVFLELSIRNPNPS